MEKIVAVGTLTSALGLHLACAGTLSKYARAGSTLSIVLCTSKKSTQNREQEHQTKSDGMVTMMSRTEPLEGLLEKSFAMVRASQVRYAHGFDHTAVSQGNVDVLGQHIEEVSPALAIIPFYKSADPILRVVGKSALLACRWVQNVLMYDTVPSAAFRPGIFSVLSQEQTQFKSSILADLGSSNSVQLTDCGHRQMASMKAFYESKIWHSQSDVEAFQSHRLQLLSGGKSGLKGSLFE